MKATLDKVTSADGTTIAFEKVGDGPPVILIGGAFNDRTTVSGLANSLAPHATAIAYDRRGRGDSTDEGHYRVEREIEDLAALADRVGGSPVLFGHSSGAVLALEAAVQGLPCHQVVAYEPTYIVDTSRPQPALDLADRLRALIAIGKRDEAASLFFTEAAGIPADMVQGMQASPSWPFFTRLAHTLPYDIEVCGPGMNLPTARLRSIRVPVVAVNGTHTMPWIAAATAAVAACIPGAAHKTLDGQDHGILQNPAALVPTLVESLP